MGLGSKQNNVVRVAVLHLNLNRGFRLRALLGSALFLFNALLTGIKTLNFNRENP